MREDRVTVLLENVRDADGYYGSEKETRVLESWLTRDSCGRMGMLNKVYWRRHASEMIVESGIRTRAGGLDAASAYQ